MEFIFFLHKIYKSKKYTKKEKNKLKSPDIKPTKVNLSNTIKKNISTENFIKFQVPWIL